MDDGAERRGDDDLDGVKIPSDLDGVKPALSPWAAMTTGGPYHHGDLRHALLVAAGQLLREEGVEGLSLRKLAERVGVSRTAPYHHFRDKHALLCALAAQGFGELAELIDAARLEPGPGLEKGLRQFVRAYLRFATSQPEQYELMFGRTIWKGSRPTPDLQQIAFHAFRRYVDRVHAMANDPPSRKSARTLRLAQASWATLHGLCRLLIDGIYLDAKDMEQVSDEAVRLLFAGLRG